MPDHAAFDRETKGIPARSHAFSKTAAERALLVHLQILIRAIAKDLLADRTKVSSDTLIVGFVTKIGLFLSRLTAPRRKSFLWLAQKTSIIDENR